MAFHRNGCLPYLRKDGAKIRLDSWTRDGLRPGAWGHQAGVESGVSAESRTWAEISSCYCIKPPLECRMGAPQLLAVKL